MDPKIIIIDNKENIINLIKIKKFINDAISDKLKRISNTIAYNNHRCKI